MQIPNPGGYQIASDMCSLLADRLSIPRTDVVAASTGVIGQKLDLAPIKSGIPRLVEGLGKQQLGSRGDYDDRYKTEGGSGELWRYREKSAK